MNFLYNGKGGQIMSIQRYQMEDVPRLDKMSYRLCIFLHHAMKGTGIVRHMRIIAPNYFM